MAFLDESHEMKNNVIAKSVEQSQSLKDEPLFINLTTEGFVVDGYLDDELKKARKVLNGEEDGISAERLLPWLYTQDSEQEVWQNRNSWMKSNPTLGIVKKWSYLDEQVDGAKSSKADRIFVLAKDFNIKQNTAQAWLNLEEARSRIEATKGVVEQARENLNSQMKRYRAGLTSQLEVNDAISNVNDSDLKYVQAVYDGAIALSDLKFAVGVEVNLYEKKN